MPKRVTPRQKRFIEKYIESGNATQAVLDAGYNVKNRKVASARGTALLNNQQVWALIQSGAEMAQSNVVKLANTARNESVRLSANKDILDRAGFAPVTRSQTTTINIQIDNDRFNEIMDTYQERKVKKDDKEP